MVIYSGFLEFERKTCLSVHVKMAYIMIVVANGICQIAPRPAYFSGSQRARENLARNLLYLQLVDLHALIYWVYVWLWFLPVISPFIVYRCFNHIFDCVFAHSHNQYAYMSLFQCERLDREKSIIIIFGLSCSAWSLFADQDPRRLKKYINNRLSVL